jgi:hypothetical protein
MVVQEAFLRFHRESRQGVEVESPNAYLSTVTTRLSIDQLRSARVRRESYVGTWLPEPLLTDTESDEIAAVVGKNEDNCRQVAVRARRQVQSGKPRFEASRQRGTSWPAGSSKPPRWGTLKDSSVCSLQTSLRTATGAAKLPHSRARSTGGIESPGCCSDARREESVWA